MIFTLLPIFLYIPYFIFAAFFSFYLPGIVLLRKISLTSLQKFVLSIGIGIVLWGWQGFVFGYLHMRGLSYLYLVAFFLVWLKVYFRKKILFALPKFSFKNNDPVSSLILLLGVLIQTSILWLMGITTTKGLYFCCGAIGDFIYHLGLTNQIIARFPPFEQDMVGVEVTNYHYWGNIVVAELVRVFHLPLFFTEFQYIGILLSLLFGLSAIVFCQLHKLSTSYTRWILFFLYFGGDFIFVVILVVRKTFDFSMGPLENGMSFLNNPPRAFAVVLFFIGLSLFTVWIKKKDFYSGLLTALVFGALIGFKVYLGIFALTGLSFVGVYFLSQKKIKMIIPIFLAFLFALIIYLPVNKSSGGMHFIGFWRSEEFIVQPALGLSHLELAREIFLQHKNWLHAFIYDCFFTFLFILSIFGSKLFGIFQTKKSLSYFPSEINIFLIAGIFISLIAGLFFWQQSGGSNSFNFLVSVYIIASIYTALSVSYWIKKIKRNVRFVVILLIIALNLPRIGYEEYKNIRSVVLSYGYRISRGELDAMRFIRESTPTGSILLVNANNYQTFIAKRNIFLGDYSLLGSHDVDTSQRQKIQKTILESSDFKKVKNLLYTNNISYLYIPVSFSLKARNQNTFLKKVFRNEEIEILQVF